MHEGYLQDRVRLRGSAGDKSLLECVLAAWGGRPSRGLVVRSWRIVWPDHGVYEDVLGLPLC